MRHARLMFRRSGYRFAEKNMRHARLMFRRSGSPDSPYAARAGEARQCGFAAEYD
jgi:hypothetical protein